MKSIVRVKHWLALLFGVSLLGFFAVNAGAEENQGITVSERGVVEAMPDAVEFTATVEGTGELAGDAVGKYRGSKRRAVDLLNSLNFKKLSVVGAGLSLTSGTPANMMAALQGGDGNQPKVADKVTVHERLTVTLAEINSMSADDLLQSLTRIFDVLKDAGVTLGPGPKSMMEIQFSGGQPGALATFRLSNTDALRQQAYEAALKQARAKAQHLAQLAGVELGDIVSIREAAPTSQDNSGGGMGAYLALIGGAASSKADFTSGELHNIPVAVSLSVQFEIAKKK